MSRVTEAAVRAKLAERLGRGGVRLSYDQAAWLLDYLDHSVACPAHLRPQLRVPEQAVAPAHRLRVRAEVAAAHARVGELLAGAA